MAATITMTLDEYELVRSARVAAENETARLRQELIDAKLNDEAVAELTQFARKALTIARFAVENLPPEAIRGWPHKTLHELSELMPALPDYNFDDQSLQIELRNFASEAARFERGRNLQSVG